MTIWAWGERKPALYTIPFSHYCEVARWSLETAGEPFEEAPFLPGTHLFAPVERLRTDSKDDSSTGRGATMPMLAESSGKVLAGDSWQCAARRGAGRPSEELQAMLEDVVGPATRSIVYSFMLGVPDAAGKGLSYCDEEFTTCMKNNADAPLWQRALFYTPFAGVVARSMFDGMVKSAEHVDEQRAKLADAFTRIEPMLGSPPLVAKGATDDGQPTAAAIALAALVMPVVAAEISLSSSSAARERRSAETARWRATAVGKFSLAVYAEHSRTPKLV